ncbi:MAG: FG-GAP-like repeat-containing protein, partial [Verrucomicrobiota bacterium]
MSSTDTSVHFGLGKEKTIQGLKVRWPNGSEQLFKDLEADRLYTITQPEEQPELTVQPHTGQLFTKKYAIPGRHLERVFDDFAVQPLLPNKMSQLGPGIAIADVDGDQDNDVFIAGAAGYRGQMHLAGEDGSFAPTGAKVFGLFQASEQMAPLFFDADGDRDLDLFVVSGGVECKPNDMVLRDRLYLNSGKGEFTVASEDALPDLRDSGSVAAVADIDRDGDLDLFVGGRSVPGSYPLAPKSRLLENQGGRFVDATEARAPGLRDQGMVTSALWSDADNDGWLDLFVTYEWGPVAFWRNDGGRLTNRTEQAGLAGLNGWWNSMAGGDFDHDGDIDYVVNNVGLNTKYHASKEHPTKIYYGDLGGQGKKCVVEAEYEGDHLFPVRGKSCSQNAMPFIREAFPSFHDFATASFDLIYSERAKDAYKVEATELSSGVLINDGRGTFTFRPLPRLAQIA